MRTLQTARLRLVPVTVGNAEELWDVLRQPHLRDYQDLPSVDVAHLRRMIESRPRRLMAGAVGRFEWLVFVVGEAGPIGWVSLRMHDRDARAAEIGYSIVADRRGRGLATEAARALIDEAFNRIGLTLIRAYCVPQNAASRALLTNIGFEPDGTLRNGATVAGQPVDVLAFVFNRAQPPP
ncbi:MAG TPA: GNAT family N-acetyltransferase [Verrucomicrobiae bacterium]|nr:GNAT family N-acetyltransferase [Verrucomicrobiae bacterium]